MTTKQEMKRMTQARTDLLMDQPWFGSLSLRLRLEASECETAETDGTTLWFNPKFTAELSDPELAGLVAHEVMHCALLHCWRRGHRDPKQWNIACDYVVNNALVKAGIKLPDGALIDAQYDGMSAEQVYSGRQQDGNPEPDGTQMGDVLDGAQPGGGNGQDDSQQGNGQQPGTQPGQGGSQQTEGDWQIAAEQATAIANAAGVTPGDAAAAAKLARQQPADWREVLRQFVEQVQPSDYTWSKPNRRFIGRGLYLPGVAKENMPRLTIAVDTSGSVWRQFDMFATEIEAIVKECKPEAIDVIYCDSKVKATQEFTPDEFTLDRLSGKGGGGTLFNPVFAFCADADEQPTAMIFFTDLDNGGEKVQQPDYPVMWVTGRNVTRKPAFGDLAVIDVDMY